MEDALTIRDIESLIFEFRGYKVMTDVDLAALYETETKKLKQQVRCNIDRFPPDFMYELTRSEKEQLRIFLPLVKLFYAMPDIFFFFFG
jgi:hypothetical protein